MQRKRSRQNSETGFDREPTRQSGYHMRPFEDFVRQWRDELAKWEESRRDRRRLGGYPSSGSARGSD